MRLCVDKLRNFRRLPRKHTHDANYIEIIRLQLSVVVQIAVVLIPLHKGHGKSKPCAVLCKGLKPFRILCKQCVPLFVVAELLAHVRLFKVAKRGIKHVSVAALPIFTAEMLAQFI